MPEFFTRGGEVRPSTVERWKLPVMAGVSCTNCRHCPGLVEKAVPTEESSQPLSVVP
jgi:hypothetical protein